MSGPQSVRRRRPLFAALLLFVAAPATAEVYKCRDAEGRLSYQDQPCPPGTDLPAPHIAPPPAYVPPPAGETPTEPTPPDDGAPLTGTVQPVIAPLPVLYRCTRYDGQETYLTEDPVPRTYQVPLWAVLPDMTRSTSGGISTSGGPTSARPPDALLGAYTTVQDRCARLGRGQLCAIWSERLSEVRRLRRSAFSDTRGQLDAEQQDLREQLAAHCGG